MEPNVKVFYKLILVVNDMIVAKPQSKSTATHCQLDTWKHSSIWFEYKSHSFIEKKCLWKCHLQKVGHIDIVSA